MQRTAEEVAKVLTGLYRKKFDNDAYEQYRLEWADLRALAGVRKVREEFIADINAALREDNHALVAFDTFLALLNEGDCSGLRTLSGRMLEKYLPGEDEAAVADGDDDEEIDDDEQ